MAEKLYQNEEWLREQYITNRKSCNVISKECRCSATTVFKWLKQFNIPRRDYSESVVGTHHSEESKARHSEANKRRWEDPDYKDRLIKANIATNPDGTPKAYLDKTWLERHYIEKLESLNEIADICNCSPSTIKIHLVKHGIQLRSSREAQRIWLKRHPDRPPRKPFDYKSLWTPEKRMEQGQRSKGRRHSPKTIERMREAALERAKDPEYIKKQSLAKQGSKNPAWINGISFEPYCKKFNTGFKERIRDNFNNQCVICGNVRGTRNLSVHHIDYNKNSICNGNEWAFVPLCTSCHTKSNTNRWHWFNLLINYWVDNPMINFTDLKYQLKL